jgi:hypothetical protein
LLLLRLLRMLIWFRNFVLLLCQLTLLLILIAAIPISAVALADIKEE